MDNQQERRVVDLNWLAGIWEGEGWFSIQVDYKRTGKEFKLNCGVSNTDYSLIQEALRILTEHQIAYYLRVRQPNGLGKIPKWEICIIGLLRVARLLEVLAPYLRSNKRENAKLMLQYIKYRQSVPMKQKYGLLEEGIVSQVRVLNNYNRNPQRAYAGRYHPSNRNTDDVRRTAPKVAEVAETTTRQTH